MARKNVADRAPVGLLVREWRERRNLSQLELASGSAVSARHLSFIETGRARPRFPCQETTLLMLPLMSASRSSSDSEGAIKDDSMCYERCLC